MTRDDLPWMTAALLSFVASENPALAGDLVEERRAGRSAGWFRRQLLGAVIAAAWHKRRRSPTVVRLVTETPYDRPDRSIRLLDPAMINLTGTNVRSVGGLGLLALIMLVTVVMPQAWFLVLIGFVGGVVVGITLIRRRRHLGLSGPSGGGPIDLLGSPAADPTAGERTGRRARAGFEELAAV